MLLCLDGFFLPKFSLKLKTQFEMFSHPQRRCFVNSWRSTTFTRDLSISFSSTNALDANKSLEVSLETAREMTEGLHNLNLDWTWCSCNCDMRRWLKSCFSLHRNPDLAQRKEYVKMHDDVLEAGGDVKIFSSLHVSGEREKCKNC